MPVHSAGQCLAQPRIGAVTQPGSTALTIIPAVRKTGKIATSSTHQESFGLAAASCWANATSSWANARKTSSCGSGVDTADSEKEAAPEDGPG